MKPDEIAFYDLKSKAEQALKDLRENCEKTGRDWKDELDEVIYNTENS